MMKKTSNKIYLHDYHEENRSYHCSVRFELLKNVGCKPMNDYSLKVRRVCYKRKAVHHLHHFLHIVTLSLPPPDKRREYGETRPHSKRLHARTPALPNESKLQEESHKQERAYQSVKLSRYLFRTDQLVYTSMGECFRHVE